MNNNGAGRVGVLLLVCGLIAFNATATENDKIPVFVKSAGTADGFTDPSKDRQDSVKDLLKRLRESKAVVLVDSEDAARVLLEVLDRGRKRDFSIMWGPQEKKQLTVRLTAGSYSTEFTGEHGTYRKAAEKVVRQLEAWIKANRSRIVGDEGGK